MGEAKEKVLCDKCKIGVVMHHKSQKNEKGIWIDINLCCQCHINSGGIPSDWHLECMATIEKRG